MIEEIEAVTAAAAAVHSSSSSREGRDMVLEVDVDVVGSVHSMGGSVCLSVCCEPQPRHGHAVHCPRYVEIHACFDQATQCNATDGE